MQEILVCLFLFKFFLFGKYTIKKTITFVYLKLSIANCFKTHKKTLTL